MNSETELHTPGDDDGLLVKVLGVVLSPFVLASEALGKAVMAFFSTAEKLNPGPAIRTLLKPLGDLALKALRWFRNPLRHIEEALDRLLIWLRRVLAPITTPLRAAIDRLRNTLVAFGRSVLRSTAAFRARVSAVFSTVGQAWRRATAPFVRSIDRLRKRLRR